MAGREGERPSCFRSSYKADGLWVPLPPTHAQENGRDSRFQQTLFTKGNRTGAHQGGRSPGLSPA